MRSMPFLGAGFGGGFGGGVGTADPDVVRETGVVVEVAGVAVAVLGS